MESNKLIAIAVFASLNLAVLALIPYSIALNIANIKNVPFRNMIIHKALKQRVRVLMALFSIVVFSGVLIMSYVIPAFIIGFLVMGAYCAYDYYLIYNHN